MKAPFFAVSGAPGAGKTTVQPLLTAVPGLVVMDADEILEKDGSLLGVPVATPEAEAVWPDFRRLWDRIIDMPRRAGHPVLFLSPHIPADLGAATAMLLLDCADEVRVERLKARGWDDGLVAGAVADARAYRRLFDTVVMTDDAGPEVVAGRIRAWMGSAQA